jgi:hypothetical protein
VLFGSRQFKVNFAEPRFVIIHSAPETTVDKTLVSIILEDEYQFCTGE